MSLTLFSTNCLWADAPKAHVWAEPRLARLPSLGPDPFLFNEPPGSLPAPLSPLAPLDARTALSKDFPPDCAPLLRALSPRYGTLRRWHFSQNAKNSKIVLHIQDVHRNYQAQANISHLLNALSRRRLVDVVALEGAFGPVDLSAFHAFPHPPTVKKVADFLLRKNKISGAIHAALTSRPASEAQRPAVVGVDDAGIYAANVRALKESAGLRNNLKEKWRLIVESLNKEETTTFNAALLTFDLKRKALRDQKLSFGEYVAFLSSINQKLGMAKRKSPQMERFREALRLESSLDFSRVEAERARLLKELLAKVSKEETADLLRHSVAFERGRLSSSAFYQWIHLLCEKNRVPLERFPAMTSYLLYLLNARAIDGEDLLREVNVLERSLYEAMTRTGREQRLLQASRAAHLVGKLLDFSLTRKEWVELQALRTSRFSALAPFLSKKQTALLKGLAPFESFYQFAEKRDDSMAKNLLKAMDEHNARVAVLVTGGFHSEGILRRTRDFKLTTFSFIPKITHVDATEGSAYLSVFTQEKSPLEKLFAGEKLFLAPLQISPALKMEASIYLGSQSILAGTLSPPRVISWMENFFGSRRIVERRRPGTKGT